MLQIQLLRQFRAVHDQDQCETGHETPHPEVSIITMLQLSELPALDSNKDMSTSLKAAGNPSQPCPEAPWETEAPDWLASSCPPIIWVVRLAQKDCLSMFNPNSQHPMNFPCSGTEYSSSTCTRLPVDEHLSLKMLAKLLIIFMYTATQV